MDGPFFLVDGHDVIWFATRADAEGYLEVYDVGSYRFFAKDGTELVVRANWDNYRVAISDEAVGSFPDDLAESLRAYLQASPRKRRGLNPAGVQGATLSELVDAMVHSEKGH
jgi:hypothetical protein